MKENILKLTSESDKDMSICYRTNAPMVVVRKVIAHTRELYNIGAGTHEHEFDIFKNCISSIGFEISGVSDRGQNSTVIIFS